MLKLFFIFLINLRKYPKRYFNIICLEKQFTMQTNVKASRSQGLSFVAISHIVLQIILPKFMAAFDYFTVTLQIFIKTSKRE